MTKRPPVGRPREHRACAAAAPVVHLLRPLDVFLLSLGHLPETPLNLLAVRLSAIAVGAVLSLFAASLLVRGAPAELRKDAERAEAELEDLLRPHDLHHDPTPAGMVHAQFSGPLQTTVYALAFGAAAAACLSAANAKPIAFEVLKRVAFAGAIAVVGWAAIVVQHLALSRAARNRPADAETLCSLKDALRLVTAGAAVLGCLQVLGAPTAPLFALGSVASISLGLATQVTAANLVSGAAILLSGHLRVGDKVTLPNSSQLGFVTAFSLDSATSALRQLLIRRCLIDARFCSHHGGHDHRFAWMRLVLAWQRLTPLVSFCAQRGVCKIRHPQQCARFVCVAHFWLTRFLACCRSHAAYTRAS